MKSASYLLVLATFLLTALSGCSSQQGAKATASATVKAVGADLLNDAKTQLAPALFSAIVNAAVTEATGGKVDWLHAASAALNSVVPETSKDVAQLVNDATNNQVPAIAAALGMVAGNAAKAHAAANAISGVALTH